MTSLETSPETTPDSDERLRAAFERLDALPAAPASDWAARIDTVPLVVLDTNVILDLWYWQDAEAAPLKEAIEAGDVRSVSTASCLKELAAVIARPHFGLTHRAQEALLSVVLRHVHLAASSAVGLVRCRDPEDEKFLNLAYAVRADALLTKDKRVLRAGRKLAALGTKTMRPADWSRAHSRTEEKGRSL